MRENRAFLKRYTDLPSTLAILRYRELTLLNPMNWDDINDRESMLHYANREKLKSLLAICFSQAKAETYHHWRVFSHGPSGICIHFFKDKLLESIGEKGIFHREVDYKNPVEFLSSYPTLKQMPFLKGEAYKDEEEYRIIFGSKTETLPYKKIPLDLNHIRAIQVSPWMAKSIFDATLETIHEISGCEDIPVIQSAIVSNEAWLNYVRST